MKMFAKLRPLAASIVALGAFAASAQAAWIKTVVVPDNRAQTLGVKALVVNGQPVIYYPGAFLPSPGVQNIYAVSRSGGVWTNTQMDTAPSGSAATSVEATLINGVPYVGIGYTQFTPTPTQGSMRIVSNAGSGWVTERETLLGGHHYGDRISIGSLNGQIISTFSSSDPSDPTSRSARYLEQSGPGAFTESTIPNLPFNSIDRLSIATVNGQPAVIAAYQNGNIGDYYVERNSNGTWTATQVDFFGLSGAKLFVDETGEPAFAGKTSGVLRYSYRRNGTWQFENIQTSGTNPVGIDAAVINGVPTIAYMDRTGLALHFRQKIAGTWNDLILDTQVNADFDSAVSLLDLGGGSVAVAIVTNQSSGSNHPVIYYENVVPEPAALGIAGLLGAAGLLRRRRPA